MAALLVLAGFGLLFLPACTHRLGRRLPPARWARFCRNTLVAGAAVIEAGVVLYAVPAVLDVFGVDVVSGPCRRILGPLVPGGATAGWAGTAASLALPSLLAIGVRGSRRARLTARIEPGLGEHRRSGPYEVVILPCDEPVALSVAGRLGQIVLSRGLQAALGPAELDAVVRHEAAHLTNNHQRFLTVSGALQQAFGFLPPVRRSLAVLRTALERWADESSTGADAERRASLRAALLTVAMAPGPVPALSKADTVLERVAALDQPPAPLSRSGQASLYASGLGLAVVAASAAVLWSCQAGVLRRFGLCPLM